MQTWYNFTYFLWKFYAIHHFCHDLIIVRIFTVLFVFLQNPLIFLVLVSFVSSSEALRILFLGPFVGTSHFLYCKSFVIELLKRGHDVTFVTSNSMKSMNLTAYTEILVEPRFDIEKMSKFWIWFNSATRREQNLLWNNNWTGFP